MDRENITNLRICVDCLYVLANGVDSDEQAIAAENMAKLWKNTNITLGALTDECGHNDATSEEHAYNCEQLGFSWSPCDGCGSTLGGDRHAATAWN